MIFRPYLIAAMDRLISADGADGADDNCGFEARRDYGTTTTIVSVGALVPAAVMARTRT